MDYNEKRVYVRIPQKTFMDTHILTPNEALMYNLRGIKLVDMTKEHNLLPHHVKNKKWNLEGGDLLGTLFGRTTAEAL